LANALRFKQLSLERQKGELARFKVVQGPDYGTIYVLVGPKALIGRGEENDMMISDLKASRVHAEVSAVAGGWNIKDKGSANGILHNGQATREAKLTVNDTITLGETTLEFTTADAATQMLVAPPRSMAQIGIEQQQHAEHKARLDRFGLGALFGGGSKGAAPGVPETAKEKSAKTVKKLIGVVIVLGIASYFFGDEEKPIKPAVKKTQDSKDLAAYLPDAPYNREIEMLFKDGLREYFLGNYSRARTQFETVLQISPGHPLSTLYLENVNKSVEGEVKLHLDHGRKAFKAGKLHDAKAHYLKVMRLLNKDRNNPNFIEAKEQYEKTVRVASGLPEPTGEAKGQ
jgi:hypothetical protein